MDDPVPQPALPLHYAGFWRRFNAYGIDATIVVLIAWLLDYFLPGSAAMAQGSSIDDLGLGQIAQMTTAMQNGQLTPQMMDSVKAALIDSLLGGSLIGPDKILVIIVSAIYNIFFVTSSWKATPGKHWLDCQVVNADGGMLNLKQSVIRHAATGISAILWMIPCLTVCYTREKLAPHDMIAKTRVIRRPKF